MRNLLQSPFCLSFNWEKATKGKVLLPFLKGGGEGFKKPIFYVFL
jgi:hypothetical protein